MGIGEKKVNRNLKHQMKNGKNIPSFLPNHFDAYDEEWLDFVVENRDKNSITPAHDYDIVIGTVAGDKVQNMLIIN
jgi:hypothetical protein